MGSPRYSLGGEQALLPGPLLKVLPPLVLLLLLLRTCGPVAGLGPRAVWQGSLALRPDCPDIPWPGPVLPGPPTSALGVGPELPPFVFLRGRWLSGASVELARSLVYRCGHGHRLKGYQGVWAGGTRNMTCGTCWHTVRHGAKG